jgi:hypothetical protein
MYTAKLSDQIFNDAIQAAREAYTQQDEASFQRHVRRAQETSLGINTHLQQALQEYPAVECLEFLNEACLDVSFMRKILSRQ